jgi:hypothetical protein
VGFGVAADERLANTTVAESEARRVRKPLRDESNGRFFVGLLSDTRFTIPARCYYGSSIFAAAIRLNLPYWLSTLKAPDAPADLPLNHIGQYGSKRIGLITDEIEVTCGA